MSHLKSGTATGKSKVRESSASAPDHVCDPRDGDHCPEDKKPIFLVGIKQSYADRPRQDHHCHR
jgi:hypothetical protein